LGPEVDFGEIASDFRQARFRSTSSLPTIRSEFSDLTHQAFYEQNGFIEERVLRNGAANVSLIANLRRRHRLYGLR